jgi:hypothetical protein
LGCLTSKKPWLESRFPDIRRQKRVYYIDPQGAEREALRQRLLNEGPILFADIEYIGTSLKCIGFSPSVLTGELQSRYVVLMTSDGVGHLLKVESRSVLRMPCSTSESLEWHYDIHGFENLVYDTMVAAYVINIEHKKDLGFLGSQSTPTCQPGGMLSTGTRSSGRAEHRRTPAIQLCDNFVTCEVAEKQQVEMKLILSSARLSSSTWRSCIGTVEDRQDRNPDGLREAHRLKAKVDHDLDQGQSALNELVDTSGDGPPRRRLQRQVQPSSC